MILIALGLDPNTTNQDDLDQARDWMLDHKDAVALVHDADGQFRLLRGEIDVAIDWSGDMFQVMSGDATDSLAYIIPSEGTFRWTDNMAIPKGAANKPLAEAFINYVYDPAVAASISNFTQYGSPNRAAIDTKLIDASLLANPAIYPPPETVAKLKTLKDLGDKAALFDTTWQEILGGVLR
jgi:spermidine/putrescine transport system substrate-binding protein